MSAVLMCPPTYFGVDYEINPWMSTAQCVDVQLAHVQWRYLRERIGEHASVLQLEPQAGLPDMVFTANAGVVVGDVAVPSRFKPAERKSETAHFARWFERAGYSVKHLDEATEFEGAGDFLADTRGDFYWAGCGFRSQRSVYATLEDWLDVEIVPLQLADPRFYHVDTCLAPLHGGYLMYYPRAFTTDSLAAIHARVPKRYRIEVCEADACGFACNAVNLRERVWLNRASADLQERLETAGLMVETIELSEFLKAGGGAKCLVLVLPGATALSA